MLSQVLEMFTNVSFLTALSAMLLAQASKIVYYLITERKINLHHFFEVGGMPSSHSALVSSLSFMVGFTQGFDSALFAISAVLSAVVMYDAIKVRPEEIAHTLIEVCSGFVFGVLIAIFSYSYFVM